MSLWNIKNRVMKKYTIIAEYRSKVFALQVDAKNIKDALITWSTKLPAKTFRASFRRRITGRILHDYNDGYLDNIPCLLDECKSIYFYETSHINMNIVITSYPFTESSKQMYTYVTHWQGGMYVDQYFSEKISRYNLMTWLKNILDSQFPPEVKDRIAIEIDNNKDYKLRRIPGMDHVLSAEYTIPNISGEIEIVYLYIVATDETQSKGEIGLVRY